MNGIRQGIPGVDFSLCGRSLPPEVLLFFPSAVQRDDLLGVPGQGGPHHVGRIPGFTLVAAAAHPVVVLEMPDDRLDLDSPLQGLPEPALAMIGMPGLAFAGNGQALDLEALTHAFLLLERLRKAPVRSQLLGTSARVGFHAGRHVRQGLEVHSVFLILRVGEHQVVLVDNQRNQGAELAVDMGLALADGCHIRLVQRVAPAPRLLTSKHLRRLLHDSLSQGDDAVEASAHILAPPGIKRVDNTGGLMKDPVHDFPERFGRLFALLRVAPAESLDPEEQSLGRSLVAPKGLAEGHLLADPLDLMNDLLLDAVQKIRIRGIGDVLGLGGGIHGDPFGLHQAHLAPGLQEHLLDLEHPLGPDALPKLHQRAGLQDILLLQGLESAEALPVGVLVEHLHSPLIRAVVAVLQQVDADHQPNGLACPSQGAVVNRKSIVQALPVDQPGSAHQLMVRAKILRQGNLEHKHLPFRCGP